MTNTQSLSLFVPHDALRPAPDSPSEKRSGFIIDVFCIAARLRLLYWSNCKTERSISKLVTICYQRNAIRRAKSLTIC